MEHNHNTEAGAIKSLGSWQLYLYLCAGQYITIRVAIPSNYLYLMVDDH